MTTESDKKKFDEEAQAFHDASPLKDAPHWYVTIRPDTLDDNYIMDLPTYWDKIEQYSNYQNFWKYPYVNPDRYKRKQDQEYWPSWIESPPDYDTNGVKQHWRFYRNGQFVLLDELYHEEKQYITTKNVVCTITKIFEFAARLAVNFNDSVFIKIQMENIQRFVLYKENAPFVPIGSSPMIPDAYEKEIETQVLFKENDRDEFARKAANLFFEHFKANIEDKDKKKIQDELRRGKLT